MIQRRNARNGINKILALFAIIINGEKANYDSKSPLERGVQISSNLLLLEKTYKVYIQPNHIETFARTLAVIDVKTAVRQSYLPRVNSVL